jgi:GTP-binding protein LepA
MVTIRKGEKIKFFNTGKEYDAEEVGYLQMTLMPMPEVKCGDVGYVITGIKDAKEIKVGDTLTATANPCQEAIKGFEEVKANGISQESIRLKMSILKT